MRLAIHGTALALSLAICSTATFAVAQAGAGRAHALELFQQSADLYREGRFAEAAELLREARRLQPEEPLLAYNLARALEGGGDLEGAVEAYESYLELAPSAADAPSVRARLEGLHRHLAEVRAVEEERARLRAERDEAVADGEGDSDRDVDPAPPAPRGPEAAPWIIVGVGGAVVLVAATLGGVAIARNGDAGRAPTHAATVEAVTDANTYATAANVCFLIGGVAMLAGAIWGTIDVVTLPGSDDATSASLRVGPGTIAIDGRF